jgi:hypothetical protein
MVLLMFLVLFRPGAFNPAQPSPAVTVMILFWVAFGGFFFGLTYGLLQICGEFAVVGKWISYAMTNRWTFEALGHNLGVAGLWANGR